MDKQYNYKVNALNAAKKTPATLTVCLHKVHRYANILTEVGQLGQLA